MKLLLGGTRLIPVWFCFQGPGSLCFGAAGAKERPSLNSVFACVVRQVPTRDLSLQSMSLLLIQGYTHIQYCYNSISILCKYEHSCQEEMLLFVCLFFNENNHHLPDLNQCHFRRPSAFYLDSTKRGFRWQHCPSQERLDENILLLFILGKR